MKDLSLYIHIPFCISKCYYCDFSSFTNINHKIDEYINSLIIELDLYKDKIKDYSIKTIFIGGGTPSCINPRYINRILEFIYRNFNTSDLVEVTIEANPGTLDKEKVQIYMESGINRVSMGMQTLDDTLLKSIGRIHSTKDFYKSYEILRNGNMKNINVDLIFGLPNQSIDQVISSLKKVVELGVEHVSYYGLILEENTKFYKLYNEGKIFLPDENIERMMYHKATEYLTNHGYKHYEISNYALPTYECKHNLVYWEVRPYLGVGLSSHSNMRGKRFFNTSDINIYIEKLNMNKLPVEGEEIIDKDTEMEEFCILGIRKIEGLSKIEFKNRFEVEIEKIYGDIIKKHIDNGLILNDHNIRLTKKGLDLSNLVEVDFLK
ncbi:oxygen-independent coproporphyrinogen-3 oxidase [Tissierella praeacuta DSM 18095]|uniref:Heme chaperone HemW n=1 Tax=Tissierella praeacuta DSM 18095 TaxID=1123404 RepID=A0A1M4S8B1_9FIRM|nr:radical SAM family heme chaperone HemW [Tissierella praeacuta]SHE28405.1 oxygen-independent coproporphyrinogen-3 oxidase [Tissierella praeacuta DSM 18095]SUP01095.1 Oxygen-independent coproporphyrinogen-III oxidase 2 [Tissierella praeacuta]